MHIHTHILKENTYIFFNSKNINIFWLCLIVFKLNKTLNKIIPLYYMLFFTLWERWREQIAKAKRWWNKWSNNEIHMYKIPIVYFQSFALPRGCIRYVHRCRIILRSTILIYALKEVIYVLALKITHYKCLVFLWLGKNYGNDRIHQAFDEYLGRSVIWGISVVFYCALLKKKKRIRKRQKN